MHSLARLALFALSTSLALAGCRGDDPGGSATDSEGSSSGSGGEGSSTALPTTSGSTTGDGTTDLTTGTPTTTNNSAGFIGTSSGGGTPQPNGGMCATDDDCMSMNCYQNPLMPGQGVCSECNEDKDCMDAGTGISCSIGLEGFATCQDGSLGDQCMSQAACMQGLFCGPVIDIPLPGIIPDTCNECEDSTDCTDGKICSPNIDFMSASGSKICVEPGSVPNDGFCPHDAADGDMACMSGHCTEATVMQIVTLGLCGECDTDMDCMMGQTCVPAMVSQDALSGSKCM